ncbi:MAG: hypothetical protein JNK34_10785 [Tabrizicola sp.]|nr:hypothetical protein [Tabrizicola sp.]
MRGNPTWTDIEVLEVMFRFYTLGETGAQLALLMGASRSGILGLVHRVRREAPAVEALRISDNALRECLEAFLERQVSAERLAKTFALHRNAVLYLIWSVMHDLAHAGASEVLNPAHDDVVVWPRWWRPVPGKAVAA